MSVLQNVLSFVPAPGEAATYNVPMPGQVVALPALDANNPALTITNTSGAPVAVLLGTSSTLPVFPDGSRGTRLLPGETVLLSADPGQLAATATYAAVVPMGAGQASLTFTRGTTAPLTLFSTWN